MIFSIPIPIFFNRESREDRELRLKGKRLREIRLKKVPTMEEENEKRILIGYPHLLEVVKEKCPKCNGKMWHDQFQKVKVYNRKLKFWELEACYNCVDCKYRVLFNLFTNKFDKKPFGKQDVQDQRGEGK